MEPTERDLGDWVNTPSGSSQLSTTESFSGCSVNSFSGPYPFDDQQNSLSPLEIIQSVDELESSDPSLCPAHPPSPQAWAAALQNPCISREAKLEKELENLKAQLYNHIIELQNTRRELSIAQDHLLEVCNYIAHLQPWTMQVSLILGNCVEPVLAMHAPRSGTSREAEEDQASETSEAF